MFDIWLSKSSPGISFLMSDEFLWLEKTTYPASEIPPSEIFQGFHISPY